MTETYRQKNTQSLNILAKGRTDRDAIDELFENTINELRRIASGMMRQEESAHLLQPTALVNEAYLRLFDLEDVVLQGQAHFMNLAACIMRRILVDHARKKKSQKRGHGWQAVTLAGLGPGVHQVQGQVQYPDWVTSVKLEPETFMVIIGESPAEEDGP